jgi:hypothetical protein
MKINHFKQAEKNYPVLKSQTLSCISQTGFVIHFQVGINQPSWLQLLLRSSHLPSWQQPS